MQSSQLVHDVLTIWYNWHNVQSQTELSMLELSMIELSN